MDLLFANICAHFIPRRIRLLLLLLWLLLHVISVEIPLRIAIAFVLLARPIYDCEQYIRRRIVCQNCRYCIPADGGAMGTRGSFGKTSGLSVCFNTRAARLLSAFSHEILTKCSVESNINFIMLCTYVQTHSENATHHYTPTPPSTTTILCGLFPFLVLLSRISHVALAPSRKCFKTQKFLFAKNSTACGNIDDIRHTSNCAVVCECVSVWVRVKHHLNVHSPKYSHIYDEVPAINRRKVKMFDGICSIE